MIIFSGEDFNPVPHSPLLATYGNKDIAAPAVKVTKENIGKIALELELDVQYTGTQLGTPFISFMAFRHDEDPIELTIYPNFWIVLLWGEIHVFRDDIFQNTFETEVPNWRATGPQMQKLTETEIVVESKNPEMLALNDELKKENWEATASGQLYRDALAAAKGPEGTEIMEPLVKEQNRPEIPQGNLNKPQD